MGAIIPRTETRITLFYFQTVAPPDFLKKNKKKINTLMMHLQTHLFLPSADSQASGGLEKRKEGQARGLLCRSVLVSGPGLMELLFIFLIFRGRPMTAEEDCIC